MKKYVIAKSRRDLKNNLKFIKRQYYKKSKKDRSSWNLQKKIEYFFNRIKEYFLSLRLSETYLICDVGLYKLFVSEIELYYANNDFVIEDLYYIKDYKEKMYERKYSIILPFILSILASLACTEFMDTVMIPLYNQYVVPVVDATKVFFSGLPASNANFLDVLWCIGILVFLYVFIGLIFGGIIWIIVKLISMSASLCSGIDFTKSMAYRYERDYVENLLEKENELKTYIKEQAEKLIVPINIMICNEMVKRNVESIEFYEVEKCMVDWLTSNPDMKKLSDGKYGTRIIMAIFYRVSLLLNEKSKTIRFSNDKFIKKDNI